MAAEARAPGRPKTSPEERGLRRLKRQMIPDAIYYGTLPEGLYPADLSLSVKQAKGKRTEADEVAAKILGKGHSVRSIQKAREYRPIDRGRWEELTAVMRRAFRK